MENVTNPKRAQPSPTLRERLVRASELRALPAEMLERLLNLPDRMDEAAKQTSRVLDETFKVTLRDTVANGIGRNVKRIVRATRRLTEQQHALAETERSLTYAIERLRRQADRIALIQTGVILLALIAGMLGGTAAALVILNWMR